MAEVIRKGFLGEVAFELALEQYLTCNHNAVNFYQMNHSIKVNK